MSETTLLVLLLVAAIVTIVLLALVLRGWRQRSSADTGTGELHAEREAARKVAEDSGILKGRLVELEAQLVESTGACAALRAEVATLQGEQAQALAHLEHAKAAQSEMQKFVAEAQTRLSAVFVEQAGKVFEERGQQFEKNVRHATEQGRTNIETLLKPFADELGKFRERVDTLYGEEAKERASLTGAVNELKTLNQDMATQAAALTQALRGNARIRGDWGELMLESVLRSSGLEEGVHYDRQQSSVDEDGRRLRPDVVVRLPDERRVVVDSKVNLVAWQDAMNAIDVPEVHSESLRRHADGLRRHVKDLADRNYPKVLGDGALEVTIAFVPIEGALSAALGSDPSLQNYAFERGVVFASPNTLMAMLRVIDRLWVRDTMQRRAREIGEAGGKVLDALGAFLGDFDRVGAKLKDAEASFSDARRRLSESSQAVIPRARRLVELGAKGKRGLSDELKADPAALLALDTENGGADDDPAGQDQ